jgi:hypothetical protein
MNSIKLTVTIEYDGIIKVVGREFDNLPTPEYFLEQGCHLIESAKRTLLIEKIIKK